MKNKKLLTFNQLCDIELVDFEVESRKNLIWKSIANLPKISDIEKLRDILYEKFENVEHIFLSDGLHEIIEDRMGKLVESKIRQMLRRCTKEEKEAIRQVFLTFDSPVDYILNNV